MSLEQLKAMLSSHLDEKVRIYTVASTEFKEGQVEHFGSAPNLEGGLATLCTCKRSMRAGQSCEAWQGTWIAGLTSRAKGKGFNGKHFLLYLMKVEKAYSTHKELHDYLLKNNSAALLKKNACKNNLGDIFIPKKIVSDELDFVDYLKPHPEHSHGCKDNDEWIQDIAYKGKSSPLLMGDSNNTFVWTNGRVASKEQRGSGNKKTTMREFLQLLMNNDA